MAIDDRFDTVIATGQTIAIDVVARDVDYWTEGAQSGSEEDDFEDVPPDQFGYTWTCTGGTLTSAHDAWAEWTAPATPGTYTVTCEMNDRPTPLAPGETGSREDGVESDSITLTVYEPFHELTILEPTGSGGGSIPVRLKVRTRAADLTSLVLEEHEDTSFHPWEWQLFGEGFQTESTETDSEGIVTEILRTDWNTLHEHNGPHLLRAEVGFRAHGSDEPVSDSINQSFTVRNLTVSASPDYLEYRPDPGTGNVITYTLDDAISDTQTEVNITVYAPNPTDAAVQVPVRSDTLTKEAGPDKVYTYAWDGEDSSGNAMPKGVYIYQISAYQQSQDDVGSDKSDWRIKSVTVKKVGHDPCAGITTMRVGYHVVAASTPYEGQSVSAAKVEVFDPDFVKLKTVSAVTPIPVGQDNYFPDFDMEFDKVGDYLFLVSARAGLNVGDRGDREQPLLQVGYIRPHPITP